MSAVPSYISAATCSTAARVYRRRRPELTALYRLVQQYLESWLARRREGDADAAPRSRHVERELRGLLECGILACGFARARGGDRYTRMRPSPPSQPTDTPTPCVPVTQITAHRFQPASGAR